MSKTPPTIPSPVAAESKNWFFEHAANWLHSVTFSSPNTESRIWSAETVGVASVISTRTTKTVLLPHA
eukprot:3933529-Rhodomonas_salina.2